MCTGAGYAEGPSEEEEEEEADDGRDEDFAPAAGGGSGRSRRPLMNPVCAQYMHIRISTCDVCCYAIKSPEKQDCRTAAGCSSSRNRRLLMNPVGSQHMLVRLCSCSACRGRALMDPVPTGCMMRLCMFGVCSAVLEVPQASREATYREAPS